MHSRSLSGTYLFPPFFFFYVGKSYAIGTKKEGKLNFQIQEPNSRISVHKMDDDAEVLDVRDVFSIIRFRRRQDASDCFSILSPTFQFIYLFFLLFLSFKENLETANLFHYSSNGKEKRKKKLLTETRYN